MPEPSYEIYAKQLFGRGHGYPLWHPEPPEDRHEIEIGDVGYLYQGSFWRIFNTTLPADDDSHKDYGVPGNYRPFKISRLLNNVQREVVGPSLFSSTVNSLEVGGEASTSLAPIGAGLKIECEAEQGAFLFVDLSADRSQMHPSKSFGHYMKTNIEEWNELASRHDLDIPKEGLIFISGTVKTNDWGLGAFITHGQGCEVYFKAGNSFAAAQLTFNKTATTRGNAEVRKRPASEEEQRAQPLPAIESGQTGAFGRASLDSVHSSHLKKDQTLFFHYYKMKKRWWYNKAIKAAGASNDPGRDSSGEGEGADVTMMSPSSGDSDVMDEPHISLMYDPVDYLLDYILNYPVEDGTEVQVAIASDTHLYTLFEGNVPVDIPAALEKMKPPILFLDEERELASLAIAEWSEDFDEEDETADAQTIRDTGKQKEDFQAPGDENCEPAEGELDPSRSEQDKDLRPAPIAADAQTGQPIILQEHTGGVTCVAFSPDGRYIASGSEDTVIILYDATNGRVLHKMTEHGEAIWTLAFSPDSRRLASGASDGMALVWDLEQSAVVAVLDGHHGVVQTIAYSPDGSKLVTSSVDFTVRIWDAITGVLLHSMLDHRAVVMTAIFSPDGRWVASCGADYKAKIWNAATGELHHTLAEHTGVVWSIAFSPDSRKVVTGSDDTTSRVWSVETGDALVILREHSGPVWSVAFSPDGKYVMSASNDATIKICDALSGECRHAFNRHDTLVNAAVFSPDGKYVASSAGDNAVMVWNMNNGQALPSMEGHLDKVTGLQFSPRGDRIVSCSDDGTVRLWTLPAAEAEAQ